MTVEYTTQAAADLKHILKYCSDKAGADVADDVVRRITGTLEDLLRHNPKAGRARPELGPAVRTFPVLPYLVFYRIAGRRIYVIRVLHGHRDIHPPLASLLVAV